MTPTDLHRRTLASPIGTLTLVASDAGLRAVLWPDERTGRVPLPEAIQERFERGLMQAARAGNTWLITGGMDTGVMRLVGKAISDYSADTVTAIGVVPYGAILRRDQVRAPTARHARRPVPRVSTPSVPCEQLGERAASPAPGCAPNVLSTDAVYTAKNHLNGANGAVLEPNHSHFVLVDDGSVGGKAWGCEIQTRGAVQRANPRTAPSQGALAAAAAKIVKNERKTKEKRDLCQLPFQTVRFS